MGVQIKKLMNGAIDFDSHPKDILPEDYADAVNIHNGAGGKGKYYVAQNIEGNRLNNFQLPAGINKTVGWLADEKSNSIIYWIQNSNGNDSILRWYQSTDLVVSVLQEKLGLSTTVANKNLVDDLLFWTDGVVPQRNINIVRAQRQDENGNFKKVKFNLYFDFVNFRAGDTYNIQYGVNNISVYSTAVDLTLEAGVTDFVTQFNAAQSDFTATSCGTFVEVEAITAGVYDVRFTGINTNTGNPSLIQRVFTNIYPQTQDGFTFLETFINADKNPPICNPIITVQTDITQKNNFIVSKIFQFAAAYRYVDSQISSKGAISVVSLGVGNYIKVDFTESRLNDDNLTIISGVDIFVKEGELGKWKFVKTLGRDEFGVSATIPAPAGTNYYNFFNDKEYSEIDDAYAAKLFESIPLTSKAEEVFDNRIGYGGNLEGYDSVCVESNLTVSYQKPPELYTIKGIIVIRPLFLNSSLQNAAIFFNSVDNTTYFGVQGGLIGQLLPLAGFTVYLAGTEFYGVSKQAVTQWVVVNGNQNPSTGTFNATASALNDISALNNAPRDAFKSGDPYGFGYNSVDQNSSYIGDKWFKNPNSSSQVYSYFEINGVPAGKYIIRIGGAETTSSDLASGGYQKSSTYTITVGSAANTISSAIPQGFEYEIEVGANVISHDGQTAAQNGNVIYIGCSAVADLSNNLANFPAIVTGYICDSDLPTTPTTYDGILEDTRIERALVLFNNVPLSPADCTFNNAQQPNWSQLAWVGTGGAVTDHNGFFWYAVQRLSSSSPVILGILSGKTGQYLLSYAQAFKQDNTPINSTTTFTSYDRIAVRNGNTDVKTKSKTIIKGRVLDVGIPQFNVPVINTLGTWVRTQQDGTYQIPCYADTFYNVLVSAPAGDPVRFTRVFFSSLNNNIVYDFANDSIPIPFALLNIGVLTIPFYNNTSPSFWYILSDMQADLLEEFLGLSDWKRGLAEEFGVIYYDRDNRQTTVNEHIQKVYVPFYTENQTVGSARISWEITSLPPQDEPFTHYQWVHTYSVPQFLQFNATSVDYVDINDASASFNNATFIKIGFNSLLDYHNRYPNSNIGYTFERGDRMNLISNGAGVLFGTRLDAEVVKDFTSGNNYYVYVQKANTQFIPDVGTLFEIYTPKPANNIVFYEFGECFEIYTLNGVKYHRGQTQDQTATQSATGTFRTGNVYYRFRNFVLGGAKYIEDSSVSDFFDSFTTQTGRPQILDKDAKQIFRPTQIRISNTYFSGSQKNGMSSFEALNQIEVTRNFGTINILKYTSQSVLLAVCENRVQPFYVGRAVVKTTIGQNLISIANDILNTADTLIGQRGTQHPQSFSFYNNNAYCWDNRRAVWWRYSSNGLEDISRYKAKSEFIKMGKLNFANVVSVYDPEHNNMVAVFQGGDAYGFNEGIEGGKNRWVTRYSFKDAEMLGVLNNQFVSWKDGQIWIHDNLVKNNFFGVQYTSQITAVANENPSKMKSWQAISEETGTAFTPIDMFTPNGSTPQMRSRLKKTNFVKKENFLYADLKGNLNDPRFSTPLEALIQGEKLRGEILTMVLENNDTSYADIYAVNIYYIDSELSNRNQ